MKGNAKDYVSTAQQFFAAYDAHDVDGMLGLCADGALGRYAPYGRESVVPIRGGIDVIWRAFPNAVPNFRVKVIELIPTDRSSGGRKEGPGRTHPSLLHSAFRLEFQDHSARCLLGQHRPQQYQGELRVMGRPSRGGSYYRQRFSRNQSTRHSSGSRCD